jgi:hypothetical protein
VGNFWTAVAQAGPWGILLLALIAFVFAVSRGILIRGGEVDRIERRIEKDTDRVLELYKDQIKQLVEAAGKKDETIAKQSAQIGSLIDSTDTAAAALDRIVKEAEKRGFFRT